MPKVRYFHAHESSRVEALDGLPLATFGQRALGYAVDLVIAVLLWFPLEIAWRRYVFHETHIAIKWDFHEVGNLIVMFLYYGLANYFGNGQTPGKWLAGSRAVSLTRDHMGLWQSTERALGYGAAVLEGGLGFLQFFWNPNRMCAQDKLAETIVIDARKGARLGRIAEQRSGETNASAHSPAQLPKHHSSKSKGRPGQVPPRSAPR